MMKPRAILDILLPLAAGIVVMLAAQGCTSHSRADEPDGGGTAMLSLRIELSNARSASSRTGEEYEPDKLPANDTEKMHTVRVIIADGNGYVEHNSLWDLTQSPDIHAVGQDFPVSAPDTKTIILVANEASATLRDASGATIAAEACFTALNASVGTHVDMEALNALTMMRTDNFAPDSPLAMSAIHNYKIRRDSERYEATLTIHRAATKYTYRITNKDPLNSHVISRIGINNVAERQYFFPRAGFTDATQMMWHSYETPDQSGGEIYFTPEVTVAPGQTVEIGPFYLPEGHNTTIDRPYATLMEFDGLNQGWRTIEWSIPQTPSDKEPMTDLPRNTHVIINATLNYTNYELDFTVCPWQEEAIDIPDFN